MAFQSYDELINMSNENPKMAKTLVNKAKQRGMPVVSRNNTGYGSNQNNTRMAALRRRMTVKNTMQDDETEAQKMASSRKKIGY